MTFYEFIKAERAEITAFYNHWLRERAQNGDDAYPLEMSPGDWDEQLLAFRTREKL